jgi:hypothetical protein
LKDNLDVFKRWLERIKDNNDLLNVVRFTSFDKEIEEKALIYDKANLLRPDQLVSRMQTEILDKMEQLRTTLPLSEEKIDSEEHELTGNIIKAMAPYGDLLGRRFSQDKCYNLNSSVTMPFPNTAFLNNPDVGHAGIAGCMSSYMLHNFLHMFASSFFAEHSQTDYNLSSEDLFQAIDKLNLNEQHYIIAFGLYFDYYIGTIKDLKKETDHKYSYKGIQILSLDCSTEFFSQMVYVMRFEDRPFLDFHEPTAEEQTAQPATEEETAEKIIDYIQEEEPAADAAVDESKFNAFLVYGICDEMDIDACVVTETDTDGNERSYNEVVLDGELYILDADGVSGGSALEEYTPEEIN